QFCVFVGGCTLEAIEALCITLRTGKIAVREGITTLLNNHLLQHSEQEGDEPRFSIFETMREYGLECLTACGEVEQARNAHAAYYQAYVEKAKSASQGTYHVHAGQWRNRLHQDYGNVRA